MSKRICNIHGIWSKTPSVTQCPQCKSSSNRVYDKHIRNKEASKFYHSREWKSVRDKVAKRDGGLCQQCMRDGRTTPYDVVDHIVEIEDGGSKLNMDNLECLCHSCHNKKTKLHSKARS